MNAPSLPDEDVLVLPAAWRRAIHPRRGEVLPAQTPPDREAMEGVRETFAAAVPRITDALDNEHSDAGMVERIRAHLAGNPDPLGAAAVVAVAESSGSLPGDLPAVVDVWVADHGLPFAACAFAACGDLRIGSVRNAEGRWTRAFEPRTFGLRWSPATALRLRSLIAAADPDTHAATLELLDARRTGPAQRTLAAYLEPTRRDWVDEACAEPPAPGDPARWMLLCALEGPERVGRLGDWVTSQRADLVPGLLATLLDTLGTAALPVLLFELDGRTGIESKELLTAVSLLPSDEAFGALLKRAGVRGAKPVLLRMMQRFPVRAARVLALAGKGDEQANELLRLHLLPRPEIAERVLSELPGPARLLVEELVATRPDAPEAPAGALPPLLVDPPWKRGRTAPDPVVIEGLAAPGEQALLWAPGEREEWAPAAGSAHLMDADWDAELKQLQEEYVHPIQAAFTLTHVPEELIRPMLGGRMGLYLEEPGEITRVLAARFGFDALPTLLAFVAEAPSGAGRALLPFRNAEVAALMAGWLGQRKPTRAIARLWFGRHGVAAVPHLVPAALGPVGKERDEARHALRTIVARSDAAQVAEAARACGDEAAAAIGDLLAADPLDLFPARMPKPGAWVSPVLLPPVLLRDRASALPADATAHLLTMLALSRPGEYYAGLAVVRDLCDPASLREFSWAVFEAWRGQAMPAKDGWALAQLGAFGDDVTVRRLSPLVRAWPGQKGHARAVAGIEVLADIGTEVALLHLHGIAQKVRFHGLRTRAQEKIEQLAADLGLSPERLADRLVPDFGLDADGGLLLDYGRRRFRVGFDEHLRPYATDEDGTLRKTLPKPGKRDDPELAPAAHKLFADLRKDVRDIADGQIERLREAMLHRRRWSLREFRELFVAHPLLWHFVRRLVWLAEDGGTTTAFRLAEDRSFADVDDAELTLPETARIGLAHPVELGGDVKAWTEVLADYEITQPFAQLARPAFTLSDAERAGRRLTRFEGAVVPAEKAHALRWRGGWDAGSPRDDYLERWISRRLAPDRHLVVGLTPGIHYSYEEGETQTLDHVWIGVVPAVHTPERAAATFGDLDPVTLSELLADLVELTGIPC